MNMVLRIFDVEHGACTMVAGPNDAVAMIDCGHNCSTGWRPSDYLRRLGRNYLDYLLITNADQDHLSDLSTLVDGGICVKNLSSNNQVTPDVLRLIKRKHGPITADAEAFLHMRETYGPPGTAPPFKEAMGGLTLNKFYHPYPRFYDTNNLSCVFFLGFNGFKIMFPGDLEKAGWLAHLENPAFVQELRDTAVLVASHHGRENGFCEEAFDYLMPHVVVMSDKAVIHGTQEMVPEYRRMVLDDGIVVTNELDRRHVLTTRCDGDILFNVREDGWYSVTVRA